MSLLILFIAITTIDDIMALSIKVCISLTVHGYPW